MTIENLNNVFSHIQTKVEERKLCLKVCGSYGIYLSSNYLKQNLVKNKLLVNSNDSVLNFFSENYTIPKDIDFVSTIDHKSEIEQLFSDLGFSKDKRFDTVPGIKRSIFHFNKIKIDIFYDGFDFNHYIDLTLVNRSFIKKSHRKSSNSRINIPGITIPVTELLLQKLQIEYLDKFVQKDFISSWWLLRDFEIKYEFDENLDNGINLPLINYYTANDWGFYITVERNLKHLQSLIQLASFHANGLGSGYKNDVWKKIDDIWNVLWQSEKSIKWKIRSLIGTKMKWYKEVDEI